MLELIRWTGGAVIGVCVVALVDRAYGTHTSLLGYCLIVSVALLVARVAEEFRP